MSTRTIARSGTFLLVTLLFTPHQVTAGVRPAHLRCEYLQDPLGIDVREPRLSWELESDERGQVQMAYQVLVASSEQKLAAEPADLWDSGKVASSQSVQIAYAGRPLVSGEMAYWKVRAWDKGGEVSPYSRPARWEMALLDAADWKGKWICDSKPMPARDAEFYDVRPAPLFRKTFDVSRSIRHARAYVSGLGYYELYLNGKRVGDHVLDPGWTSYARRVLYSTYDVTRLLKSGSNAAGIWLGNGWYNPLPLRMWGWLNIREHLAVGPPRCILQLNIEYEDGSRESVVTDESWRVGDSPILKNSVYLGEVYDARKEIPHWDEPRFDDSIWRHAIPANERVEPLRSQMLPPIRSVQSIKPVKITEPTPGTFIIDMGRNFAGWVTLRVHGEAGREVKLRYGELLHKDGTLNGMTAVCGQIKKAGVGGPGAPDVAMQSDVYICKGDGEEVYTPRFTFHGFRYVEVTGYPGRPSTDAIEGHILHSDLPSAGSFTCSSETLNRIQEMTRATLRSNMFSVQSDCPGREKFGYGGDIIATSETAMFNFDMSSFYAKAVSDLGDAVRENGGFTETAPFVGIDAMEDGLGGGAAPIGWGTVQPVLLSQMYQYCGDKRLLEQHYPAAVRWLEFLDSHAENHCINRDIGDHETLAPKVVPLTSTAFYYLNADLLSRLASVLGRSDDTARFAKRAEEIKAAFNTRFLDSKTGRYATGTQACQAFALQFDLVPQHQRERTLQVLLADIEKQKGHLSTGIFGTKYMLDSLTGDGRADVAYKIVTQPGFPGWVHMLEGGATTLWEHWEFSDNTYSHNHPMFGSVSGWFFNALGGIQPAPDAVGFNRVLIRPAFVPEIQWAKAHYDSIHGPITSEWKREQNRVELRVAIPPNVTAIVQLPAHDREKLLEGGRPVAEVGEIRIRSTAKDHLELTIGSGEYDFSLPQPTHAER